MGNAVFHLNFFVADRAHYLEVGALEVQKMILQVVEFEALMSRFLAAEGTCCLDGITLLSDVIDVGLVVQLVLAFKVAVWTIFEDQLAQLKVDERRSWHQCEELAATLTGFWLCWSFILCCI